MNKIDFSKFFFYEWRYWIGYGLIALGLISALILVGLYLPGGISGQEVQSVIDSSATSLTQFGSNNVINLPYNLLQHASIAIFGVSVLSIKLPSIILAFLSAVGIVLLLRSWFRPSVGVLASLIAITTGQFLFIAQNGTPDVLFLFWPISLILIANLISTQKRFKFLLIVAFCAITALSLYTPISIYVPLIFASVVLLHPHLRYIVKRLPRKELFVGMVIALIILVPLAIAIIKTPGIIPTFFGIPSEWPNIWTNLTSLGVQYFGFMKTGGDIVITPFFEFGSMLIIAIGVYYAMKTRATAKNYVILIWTLCLIPVVVLNPSYTSITYLPLVLLLASGLSELLFYWYGLFPRNPYARIGGLIPVVILVVVLVFSGVSRYLCGYRYDPNIVPNFSKDLRLIPSDTKNIVVADSELPFYRVMAKYDKEITISTMPASDTFLVTKAAKSSITGYKIDRIITTSNSNDSDRFYVYSK